MTATPCAAQTAALRRPIRRLLRAYFVTMQVVLSYTLFSLRRRLRNSEKAEQLMDQVHRKNAQRVLAAIID